MSVLTLSGMLEKQVYQLLECRVLQRAESKRTKFIIGFLRKVKTGLIQSFFPGKGHQASNPDFTTK